MTTIDTTPCVGRLLDLAAGRARRDECNCPRPGAHSANGTKDGSEMSDYLRPAPEIRELFLSLVAETDDRGFAVTVCHFANVQPLPRELRTALAGLSGLSHAHTGQAEAAHDGVDAPGRHTLTWTGTGAELWDCAVTVAGLDPSARWPEDPGGRPWRET